MSFKKEYLNKKYNLSDRELRVKDIFQRWSKIGKNYGDISKLDNLDEYKIKAQEFYKRFNELEANYNKNTNTSIGAEYINEDDIAAKRDLIFDEILTSGKPIIPLYDEYYSRFSDRSIAFVGGYMANSMRSCFEKFYKAGGFYGHQTIPLMSQAVKELPNLNNFGEGYKEYIKKDCEKELLSNILNSDFEYILLDLSRDILTSKVIKIGDAYIADPEELICVRHENGAYEFGNIKENKRAIKEFLPDNQRIDAFDAEFFDIWKKSFSDLINLLKKNNKKIIIWHKKNANKIFQGDILEFSVSSDWELQNIILEKMLDYVKTFDDLHIISVPDELNIAAHDTKFGEHDINLIDEAVSYSLDAIEQIIVPELISGRWKIRQFLENLYNSYFLINKNLEDNNLIEELKTKNASLNVRINDIEQQLISVSKFNPRSLDYINRDKIEREIISSGSPSYNLLADKFNKYSTRSISFIGGADLNRIKEMLEQKINTDLLLPTTVISLISDPIIDDIDLSIFNPNLRKHLNKDFNKKYLKELLSADSQYVLIDLANEMENSELYKIGTGYFNLPSNLYSGNSKLIGNDDEEIFANSDAFNKLFAGREFINCSSPEFIDLWKQSFFKLCLALQNSGKKVIVWDRKLIDKVSQGGLVDFGDLQDTALKNSIIKQMSDYAKEILGDNIITVPENFNFTAHDLSRPASATNVIDEAISYTSDILSNIIIPELPNIMWRSLQENKRLNDYYSAVHNNWELNQTIRFLNDEKNHLNGIIGNLQEEKMKLDFIIKDSHNRIFNLNQDKLQLNNNYNIEMASLRNKIAELEEQNSTLLQDKLQLEQNLEQSNLDSMKIESLEAEVNNLTNIKHEYELEQNNNEAEVLKLNDEIALLKDNNRKLLEELLLNNNKLSEEINLKNNAIADIKNLISEVISEERPKILLNSSDAVKYKATILKNAGIIDENWYLENYPDANDGKEEPAIHWVKYGFYAKRKPKDSFE